MNPKIDITGIKLETERLILRPFEKDNLKDFYEYAKVPGVGEMAGWMHHQPLEDSEKILDILINGKKTFAILDKISGKVIGSFGIEEYDEKLVGEEFDKLKAREIGYVLSKDFWGHGYMPEAGRAILKYCFQILDLDIVFCGYFKRNTQSKRVTEKLGFKYLLDYLLTTYYGMVENKVLTILSRSDWEKEKNRRMGFS